MTMLPKPVLAPAVALAGFRPTLNTEPFVHCTNRLLVVPLLAVKMGLLGLEATEPKSISSTVAPLNTAAVQVAVMVILTLKFLVSVAAFAAETAKARVTAAASLVNFIKDP